MPQPIVDDPQPGDLIRKSEADYRYKLASDIREAKRLAGPMPQPSAYLCERGFIPHTIDANGFLVEGTGLYNAPPAYSGDPNAESMASDYKEAIAAWMSRFNTILGGLRKSK